MNWINRIKKFGESIKENLNKKFPTRSERENSPWTSCHGQPILRSDLEKNLFVCQSCNHHHRINPLQSFGMLFDNDNYEVFIGLLTGNIEEGARIKIKHYGIEKYFMFGAFGCDHFDRNKLGPIALERARQNHGLQFDSQETFVIGDTPKDINCAKAFGARSLAVATGSFSCEQLMDYDPDYLLDDLSDWEKISNFLLTD